MPSGVRIKFCGLTRAEDAAAAAAVGASYAGVIFAGGPRTLTPARAREVLAPVTGTGVLRVGVFGEQSPEEIAALAHEALVDVIQLHSGPQAGVVARVRQRFAGPVWSVLRTSGRDLPEEAPLPAGAAALVLDAAVPGQLGGTGVVLDWEGAGRAVAAWRSRAAGALTVVLAGGLRPATVARAVALVRPDVVDVSSGVESAPGIKDPEAMRAFAWAARGTIGEG
jgi:phosphoribosylanthranilate isomerase